MYTERRAPRPYFKKKQQEDFAGLLAITFIVGAMLGATITLAVVG